MKLLLYINKWGGGLGSVVGGSGGPFLCHLVLRECIWNAPAVLLVLQAFDDAGSLGSPPRQMVYSPWFNSSTLGDCLPFPCGE